PALAGVWQVPVGARSVAVICLGPADELCPAAMRAREGWTQPRPLEELLFIGRWGHHGWAWHCLAWPESAWMHGWVSCGAVIRWWPSGGWRIVWSGISTARMGVAGAATALPPGALPCCR